MLEWKIVDDMVTEDGEITSWFTKINHHKYGEFVWITKNYITGKYAVEVYQGSVCIATAKTLISAKRWVSSNLIK